MSRKSFLFILIFIFNSFLAFGQVAVIDEANVVEIRQRTFDQVWKTINERHFDSTFGGVDWKKVGEVYQPKAMAAKSDDEFHAVLNQMLGELNQSHFSIFTKNIEINSTKCNDGVVGIELKMIDNQPVIFQVEKDSAGEKAGLKTGFVLTKIDDKSIAEILLPLEEVLYLRKMTDAMKRVQRERTLMRSVCGTPETPVRIEALDGKNIAQTFEMKRTAFKGEVMKVAEGIPAFKLSFFSGKVENNIGYIRFNVWIPTQSQRFREAIRALADCNAIIIDLRGNPGGMGNLVDDVGGTMFDKKVSFGTFKRRNFQGEFTVNPQSHSYQGKVVVLTDYASGSTSEIFTAGIQATGRAKIIGERTAGAVLPATIDRLPTGASFMYAVADYRSPSGVLIEGRGVTPDIEVKLTRESLLAGHDSQLEAAVREVSK
jgi:carboxyl-terminal processing protease